MKSINQSINLLYKMKTIGGVISTSIKIFSRELWKSSKILLTYGEIRKEEDDEEDGEGNRDYHQNANIERVEETKFNGLVTSLQVFILLTTFVVILFIAPFFVKDVIQVSTKLILIILMSIAATILITFSQNEDRFFISSHKKNLGLRGRMVLIGITIFFVCGSFLDLWIITFILHCFPVYIRCKGQALQDNIISIIFHCLRVMYLGGLTAFCNSYRSLRFKDRCLTRYGLMLILVANLAVWFDVLLRQTSSRLKVVLLPSYIHNCSHNISEETVYFVGCLNMNGTLNVLIKNSGGGIIYPFLFQFSLLVLECFVHWFVLCGKVHKTVDISESLRKRASSHCLPSDELSSTVTSSTDGINRKIKYAGLLNKHFVVIILMNTLFVLLNFLPLLAQTEEKRTFGNVAAIYNTIYWFVNILFTFFGYYCTTAFKDNPKKKKFKSLNYLLIISAIGPYIYVVTAFESISLTYKNLTEPVALTVTKEVMFFLSVICQIPFCFLAGRVVLPSKNHDNEFKVNYFKTITLHMAISNCVLWIVDSFLGAFNIQYEDSTLQIKYYRTASWMFLDNIIQPLSVFFRFNSFLLFTAAHIRITTLFSYKAQHVD